MKLLIVLAFLVGDVPDLAGSSRGLLGKARR